MAGAVPGVMLGLSLMLYCFVIRKIYFPVGDDVPKGKRMKIVIDAILPLFTLVIIMGGMAAGIFTATESAAVACIYRCCSGLAR